MTEFVRRDGWPEGIDNRANWKDVPLNRVRDAVNVDALASGSMALRGGFEQVVSGTDIRGAVACGSYIVFADRTDLKAFNTTTNSTETIATIAGAGRFTGDVLNDELFFCTENQTLRFKAGVLRAWGIPTPASQPVPTVVGGGLLAGTYQCAVTYVDAYGEEGGTTQAINIAVPQNSGLQFTLTAPAGVSKVRLYISSVNGSELYLQYEGTGSYTANVVRDDTARLDTMFARDPVCGDFIAKHNACLCIAQGNTLWLTLPMRPHLRNVAHRFFQYPAQIDAVVSVETGIYVLADKTYFITGVEGSQPQQAVVFDFGGVYGSHTTTPDGEAIWMTQYGVARGDGNGAVTLLSQARFVPELANRGGSGIVERNGNQMVVTTTRGPQSRNSLAASDYYEAEVITP